MKCQITQTENDQIINYIKDINYNHVYSSKIGYLLLMNFLKSSKYIYNNYNIESFSEFGQDNIVIDILKNKKNGYFIDVGCCHPFKNNNSYTFEKNLEWCGIGFDTKVEWDNLWITSRKMTKKYGTIKSNITPNGEDCCNILKNVESIDFVSIDIDGGENEIFLQLMKLQIKPKIFIIEHDIYRKNRLKKVKTTHEILNKNGYKYLVSIGVDDVFVKENLDLFNYNENYGYNIKEFLNI